MGLSVETIQSCDEIGKEVKTWRGGKCVSVGGMAQLNSTSTFSEFSVQDRKSVRVELDWIVSSF